MTSSSNLVPVGLLEVAVCLRVVDVVLQVADVLLVLTSSRRVVRLAHGRLIDTCLGEVEAANLTAARLDQSDDVTTPLAERTATAFSSKRNSQTSPMLVIEGLSVDRAGCAGGTISLARLGARMSGLDFSPASIDVAHKARPAAFGDSPLDR